MDGCASPPAAGTAGAGAVGTGVAGTGAAAGGAMGAGGGAASSARAGPPASNCAPPRSVAQTALLLQLRLPLSTSVAPLCRSEAGAASGDDGRRIGGTARTFLPLRRLSEIDCPTTNLNRARGPEHHPDVLHVGAGPKLRGWKGKSGSAVQLRCGKRATRPAGEPLA